MPNLLCPAGITSQTSKLRVAGSNPAGVAKQNKGLAKITVVIVMIMFYEHPFTILGEKIVTVIGVLVLTVILSVSIVGFHVVMRLV
jgi:hypothetical protein